MDNLIKVIRKCWRISRGDISNDEDDSIQSDGHKTGLVGTGDRRSANIECYNCGKKCHNDFPNKNRGGKSDNGAMECYECGRRGHRKPNYWELERNAHKRPTNWVSSKNGKR